MSLALAVPTAWDRSQRGHSAAPIARPSVLQRAIDAGYVADLTSSFVPGLVLAAALALAGSAMASRLRRAGQGIGNSGC